MQASRPLPNTTYKTVGVIEKAMLGTSHSFFLLHLFQVIIILDVLTGSQRQDGDSKTGDWVAGVAERAEEPAVFQTLEERRGERDAECSLGSLK